MTIAWFGWIATAVQTISYIVPSTSTLKKIQAVAACLWIAYGVKLGATPIIVANLIVGGAALLSSFRNRRSTANPAPFGPVLANAKTNPAPNCD